MIAEGALEVGDGYRAKNDELGGTGVLFLRAGHVKDTHVDFDGVDRFRRDLEGRVQSKMSRPGDAVVTTKGNSTGRTTFVSASMPPFVYSPHLSYWRSLDPARIEGGFLRYWSKSSEFTEQLGGMKASTDMAPYLSLVDQKRLQITIPVIEDQRSIARVLGTLDDKIELNRRMSETLESMARALFMSWFVAFDPVRAKAGGRPTALPTGVADLFPSRFADSDLGEIPEGWHVGSILEIACLLSGGTPKTDRPDYWNGGIPWASAKDVSQSADTLLVETERTITAKGLAESATQIIPAFSSVVVARGATTGRMVLFGRDMAMNQTCYALASTGGTPFGLYCRLQHVMDSLVHAAHGSVFDTITTSTFALSRIVIPPVAVLAVAEEQLAPLFKRMLSCRLESYGLSALRDTLLPKLLSGDVRVPVS